MAPFDRLHTSSYWRSIVTMAPSSIISEIKRDIGRKSRFFIPLLHSTPQYGPRRNIAKWFGVKKTRMVWLPDGEKSTIVTDRRTDWQTDTA